MCRARGGQPPPGGDWSRPQGSAWPCCRAAAALAHPGGGPQAVGGGGLRLRGTAVHGRACPRRDRVRAARPRRQASPAFSAFLPWTGAVSYRFRQQRVMRPPSGVRVLSFQSLLPVSLVSEQQGVSGVIERAEGKGAKIQLSRVARFEEELAGVRIACQPGSTLACLPTTP